MRREFGALGDDGAVGIDRLPAGLAHGGVGAAQELAAVGAGKFGGGVGEVAADVAQASGAEQGVGERV